MYAHYLVNLWEPELWQNGVISCCCQAIVSSSLTQVADYCRLADTCTFAVPWTRTRLGDRSFAVARPLICRQNTNLNLFRQKIFFRSSVFFCWKLREISVFCHKQWQFCLLLHYKVVCVHLSGETDNFNTHCSTLIAAAICQIWSKSVSNL